MSDLDVVKDMYSVITPERAKKIVAAFDKWFDSIGLVYCDHVDRTVALRGFAAGWIEYRSHESDDIKAAQDAFLPSLEACKYIADFQAAAIASNPVPIQKRAAGAVAHFDDAVVKARERRESV